MFLDKIQALRLDIQRRTSSKLPLPWSWFCRQLFSLLLKYPTGLTQAIIYTEMQNAWENRRLYVGVNKTRKVTVESIRDSKCARFDGVLEVIATEITEVPGTRTKLITLKDELTKKHDLQMYLHQKFYEMQHVLLSHKLRFTSCRLLTNKQGIKKLLPSEHMVVLLDGDNMDINFSSFEGIDNEMTVPHYSNNVQVEVKQIFKEETLHDSYGGTIRKISILVVDSNDVNAYLMLWDEQLVMSNLFKEADILYIERPYVVPHPTMGFTIEYGPATVLYIGTWNPQQELVQTQSAQNVPVSVTKDCHGFHDYSTFPEQVELVDLNCKMINVSLMCNILSVERSHSTQEDVEENVEVFELTVGDEQDSTCLIIVYSDNQAVDLNSFHCGQVIFLDGVLAKEGKFIISTSEGGKIWNVSSLPGWLASQCLCEPISFGEAVNKKNFSSQAVITETNKKSAVVHVHAACGGSAELYNVMTCSKCHVAPLIELKTKNYRVDSGNYWKWQFGLFILLTDHTGAQLSAHLTAQAAHNLLQMTAGQFAALSKQEQEHVLEGLVAQEFIFGLSVRHGGDFQVDAISDVHCH